MTWLASSAERSTSSTTDLLAAGSRDAASEKDTVGLFAKLHVESDPESSHTEVLQWKAERSQRLPRSHGVFAWHGRRRHGVT